MKGQKTAACGICGDYPVPLQEVSAVKCYPIRICAGCLEDDHGFNLAEQEQIRREQHERPPG